MKCEKREEKDKIKTEKSKDYRNVIVETFKMDVSKEDNGDKLVIDFGNFIDDNKVIEEVSIAIPIEKAIVLANNLASVSAYYQVSTGKYVGVPDATCDQMKKLMEEAGLS